MTEGTLFGNSVNESRSFPAKDTPSMPAERAPVDGLSPDNAAEFVGFAFAIDWLQE